MWPSLWKSHGYVAMPYLFHVVLQMLTCETLATDVKLSWASNNRIPLLKTFRKQIEVAPMPVLSCSATCRTAIT